MRKVSDLPAAAFLLGLCPLLFAGAILISMFQIRPDFDRMLSIALLITLFLFIPATSQTQPQLHQRITQTEVPGRRLELTTLRGARLFTSPTFNTTRRVPLIIHFHGAPWLIETHIARHQPQAALITVNLGAGSIAYRRPFEREELFREVLAEAAGALSLKRGWSSITLTGFSAGYGGIREILRRAEYFKLVNNVLLLDGMHAGYVPEGKPLVDGGTIKSSDVDVFVAFAREAIAGRKSFVVTHSRSCPAPTPQPPSALTTFWPN